MSHHTLTPAQAERLEMLIEEAGEVIQAASKVLRHGYGSYDPTKPEAITGDNRRDLEDELFELECLGHFMYDNGDIKRHVGSSATGQYMKVMRKKSHWMHHQHDAEKNWE